MTSAYHLCKSIERRDINAACFRVLREHAENGKLGTDGFPTAGWSADEYVVITVVNGVEDCNQTNSAIALMTYNNVNEASKESLPMLRSQNFSVMTKWHGQSEVLYYCHLLPFV